MRKMWRTGVPDPYRPVGGRICCGAQGLRWPYNKRVAGGNISEVRRLAIVDPSERRLADSNSAVRRDGR
jgi:hypothetical protein